MMSNIARIHDTLTDLTRSIARLEERLQNHMDDEHKSFNEALSDVKEIKAELVQLKSLVDRGRGAWWLLLKLGALLTVLAGGIAWAANYFKGVGQ